MTAPHNPPENAPSRHGDLTGRLLGRFRIESRLGEGGMGEVYLAEDTRLKRRVALKRVAPQWRADPRLAQRFHREVELASRLSHPHIAAVYDVFEHDEETFLVMEYVEGHTLRLRLHGKPIPPAEFLDIASQCASAMNAAHQSGVLHRDLKPENILITRDGQVKILDFGLAKDLPRSADSTLAVTDPGLKGTPGYMAPEALLEKDTDARADLFSLGVVFYEMLAGRHPFLRRGDSFVTTVNRVIGETPKPLHSLNPNISPSLDSIVTRLLAKEPAERYQTAGALLADLKAALGGSAVSAPPPLAARLSFRRSRSLLIAVLVFVAVAAVAGIWAYRHFTRPVVTTNDWILLADFSNQTGQPIFDDTVTQALRDALQQSHRVRLVPRSQAMAAARLLGKTSIPSIDAALGREICLRDNYRGLLTGQISSLPPDFVISVKLEDPSQEVPVYSTQVSFRQPAQLYPAVDRLARSLRENLGESLADIRTSSAPLAQVTTPSLQALQRFTRAMELYNDGRYADALGLLQSAVSADPDFAMAHLYMAQVDDLLGNLSAEKEQMDKALAGAGRVSERERYLIQALYAGYLGDYSSAASKYRLLTELYPDDLLGWKGLGEAAEYAGLPDQAIDAERHVLQISPDNGADYSRLIELLASAGRLQEALGAYQSAVRRGIDNPGIHREVGVAYMVLGDPSSAAAQFNLCAKSGGLYGQNLSSIYRAQLLLYQGKLAAAIQELQAGLVLDVKQGSAAWTPRRLWLLGQAFLAQGKTADAAEQARQLDRAAAQLNDPESLGFAGTLALRVGQRAMAQSALKKLDQLHQQQPNASFLAATGELLRGAVQLADGHPGDALTTEFRAYAFSPIPQALFVEAQAYASSKQWDQAAASYRAYLSHPAQAFDYYSSLEWSLAHLDLARALLRAGHRDQAQSAYADFLKLWAAADPDLPILRQARAEMAALSSPAKSSLLFGQMSPAPLSIPGGKDGLTEKKETRKKETPRRHLDHSRRFVAVEGL